MTCTHCGHSVNPVCCQCGHTLEGDAVRTCRDEHCMAAVRRLLALVRHEHMDLRDPRSLCHRGECSHAMCAAVREAEEACASILELASAWRARSVQPSTPSTAWRARQWRTCG